MEELGNGGPQERDWRGIATALLVIMFICSLIALAVFIFTPMTAAIDHSRVPINLTALGKLRSPVTNVRFVGADAIIYENVNQGVLRLSLKKMETETLLDKASVHRTLYINTFATACTTGRARGVCCVRPRARARGLTHCPFSVISYVSYLSCTVHLVSYLCEKSTAS
ncbi:hypothetical protein Y032_0028g1660 [Ancylostoma ceylanicum]|uniref:Uncharacterized protein n=1 Tax=Ancylostoma ceylanicum TaxID=53326 RepID=A0A016UUE0_9BILA|nr:hypothetical protein Y032_0028g1660 [Ancylostoma ceylanicum]